MLHPLSDSDAVIVEAVRTPIGRRNGTLSGIHLETSPLRSSRQSWTVRGSIHRWSAT